METKESIQKELLKLIGKHLIGKKIVRVRYMDAKEVKDNEWYKSGIVLVLNDGNIIYPIANNEGNDAGAMGTSFEGMETIGTF
jgi:hypothetical protein